MVTTFANSLGFHILSDGRSDVSIGFGGASYNASQNQWGYLGKSSNSAMENVGYGIGTLANAW